MAFSFRNPNWRNKSGVGSSRARLMNEINVTPFVDVMLVLLIVFMITAPLLTPGILVDLPEASKKPLPVTERQALTITIHADERIFLQETEVKLDELVPRLEAIAGTGYEDRIFIRGDKGASYGAVAEVLGRMQDAGFINAGLVTDPQ